MTRLWLIRAGAKGERENIALDEGVAAPGFTEIADLTACDTREKVLAKVEAAYPDHKPKAQKNFAAQLNQLRNTMMVGDLVVMPLKTSSQIAIGKIAGPYAHHPVVGPSRPITWVRTDVLRSAIKQDLLYSLGAFLTICEVHRNEAAKRVQALLDTGNDPGPVLASVASPKNGVPPAVASATDGPADTTIADTAPVDIDEIARGQIIKHIASEFTGHELARLIEALLQAEGYHTSLSPPGPDGGVDILAAPGLLGFGQPKICVQVKSGSADTSVVQALKGTMQDVGATHGLLVAWGGVTQAVKKQLQSGFFQIRLWQVPDVLDALFRSYDRLPEEFRKKIPLKRTLTLVLDALAE